MSTDLVHWERLPPALIPDTEYDYDGVFSGSTTLLEDGTPAIFFTGACLLRVVSCSSCRSTRQAVDWQKHLQQIIVWLSVTDVLQK